MGRRPTRQHPGRVNVTERRQTRNVQKVGQFDLARPTSNDSPVSADTSADTFTEWLEWVTVYQRWLLSVTITTEGGGLAIQGLSLFDEVRLRNDVFGMELSGLMFYFRETDVIGVVVEPSSDTLMFTVRDQASFVLRPLFAQGDDVTI